MWGEHTHISLVEYWRWWVVHLWVEGFFEVFATAVIAFLFTRLGLLRASSATTAVLFATIVFLSGGVLGTLHHLYFTGTPTSVIALGASFSALEVVPLAFVGFEAYQTCKLAQAAPWMQKYRWPIVFFTAVAFWNVVGAGLFGFLINPPLPLYYMFYASCPAVCPLIIDTLRATEKALTPPRRADLRVLMISIDPERDSVAALRTLAEQRHIDTSRWSLARADDSEVRTIAAMLNVQYRQLPSGDFNHSTVITLLSPQGEIQATSSKLGTPDPQLLNQLR